MQAQTRFSFIFLYSTDILGVKNFFLHIFIWNEEFSAFPQPHKGCPRSAMNASIHLTHSFAFGAFFMEISFTTVGFENCQNLKLIFQKNAWKRKNKRHTKKSCATKIIPIKLYTPLLYVLSKFECNPWT